MPLLNHQQLVRSMQMLGYDCTGDGVCHGVSMMGIQAFLVNELDVYHDRLAFIHGDLFTKSNIEKVKEKLARQSVDSQPPKRFSLTKEEQSIIDALAFFDGVYLYQNPHQCSDYFGIYTSQTETERVSPIVQSKKLEQQGGMVKVKAWPGIYSDNELRRYFLFLDQTAKTLKESFSVSLASDNHTISLNYDARTAQWYGIDVNQLPAKLLSVDQLAEWVKGALFETGNMTAFESSVYFLWSAISKAKVLDTTISQSDDFKALHEINKDKKNRINSRGATLAYIAAGNGHVNEIKALREAGADLNKAITTDGATPAFAAAQNGYADVIQVLYDVGADLNKARTTDGATPAFIAAQNGHVDVIKLFHKAGVYLNTAAKTGGATPVFIAAQMGHADVIQAFLEAGVDLDRPNLDVDGTRPVFIAAQMGHADVIKLFHKAGVNLNQTKTWSCLTLAAVAAYWNHVSVLVALKEANVDLDAKTPFGSPLDVAIERGNAACVEFLKKYRQEKQTSKGQMGLFSTQQKSSLPANSLPLVSDEPPSPADTKKPG